MRDGATDVVQRAAARLQKVSAAPPSIVERAHAREVSGSSAAPPATAKQETIQGGAAPHKRMVTLDVASLAQNGITLPGAGISRTIQEFRAIKRHIMANASAARGGSAASNRRVVLVTSAKQGDGKTFTAINLGLALAYEKDTRVLLLDADAHRQALLEYLGISADAGWVDLVSARSVTPDLVIPTNVPGLEVLPAGRQRPEIPELMSSRGMKTLLDDLVRRDPDRYIIIDSMPCLTSMEPTILAALVAQTVFVVAAHRTSRDDIDSSLRLLQASPSISLVLNRTDPALTEQFNDHAYTSRQ